MESLSTQITNYLLSQSWQIAVLTITVAVITFLLRNKSAHIRYILWLIVLAKCLVPPLYTIPVAVLPEQEQPKYVPAPPIAKSMISENRVPEIAVTESPGPVSVWSETRVLLVIGWLAGVVALSFYYLVNALRTQIWLYKRRKELPSEYKKNIESLFITYGVRRMPRVWLLDKISQPFVWGLVRGSIYLPAELVDEKHAKFHTSLLGHELSHVIRLDALINSLQVIAQTIFWFHPFVWWTNRKIRAEREKCCDEMTIARLNALPEEYSEAIVEILAVKYEQTRPVPSLAVAGQMKHIEERIKTMLRPGKKFYKRPSLLAATVVLFIAFLTIPTAFVLTARGQVQPAAQSVASEKPEPPRYAARTFNSKVAFDVWIRETSSPATERQIGRTPSTTPLEIPACWLWGVQPSTPVNDWDLLTREISQNEVPGLRLEAVDSDLKQLAGLVKLRSLDLRFSKITDAGLAYLKGMSQLEELVLIGSTITDVGLLHLKDMTGLQNLILVGTNITDKGLEHIKGMTGLRNLLLGGTKITDLGLEHIKDMTGLQTLALQGATITDSGLQHLKGMTGLQQLILPGTSITDVGLEHLKGMTGLQQLVLQGAPITDVGLQHLKGMTSLRHLILNGTKITDTGLEHLKGMTGLQGLLLRGTNITDVGLEHLKGMTGLQNLNLIDTKITDKGMEYLKDLTGLQGLWLSGTKITDMGLGHIEGLTKLQNLGLLNTQITDDGMEHLKGMTKMQELGLTNTKISNNGLVYLKGMTGLVSLYLDGTQVTDAGLEHLKGLTGLLELALQNTKISDKGLEYLKGLNELRSLYLDGTKVTDAGIQQLKQSLPRLTISRGQT